MMDRQRDCSGIVIHAEDKIRMLRSVNALKAITLPTCHLTLDSLVSLVYVIGVSRGKLEGLDAGQRIAEDAIGKLLGAEE